MLKQVQHDGFFKSWVILNLFQYLKSCHTELVEVFNEILIINQQKQIIMKKVKLIVAVGLITAFTSCQKITGIKGEGNIVPETVDVSNFEGIDASIMADITVKQGETVLLPAMVDQVKVTSDYCELLEVFI